MQMQRTMWYCLAGLAVLAGCGPIVFVGATADKQDEPQPLPAETAKAWQDAGAVIGWMKNVPPKSDSYRFWAPWREKAEAGAMPAFRLPGRNAGSVLAKLPDPGTAFGLDFHCGFYAGVKLQELAELKNLQSLNIGGVQGDAYADLKELAALKYLHGLYLFYLPVTDEQLKNLAGLKRLQTLDLCHTRVTDAGLKELAGLKSLQALNLGQTEVTDAGLKELAGLKSLQELDLHQTRVTAAGVAALQKELPACKIIAGDD
jgi:internalin A